MITIQKANTILKSTTRILPPTPRTLFRNGEEGAIIDASRAETAFADEAGTTPATYGGSVARVDDIGPNGRNAVQSSSSLRPLLGRLPETGRRNLGLSTEAFNNALWDAQAFNAGSAPVATDNYAAGPLASTMATRIQFTLNGGTTASDVSQIRNVVPIGTGTHTGSIWLRSNTGTDQTVALVFQNTQMQVLTVTPSWQRFVVSGNIPVGGNRGLGLRVRGTFTDDSADILAWGAQLELGATVTDYQRVGASVLDVTEAGLASPGFLRFDLVDDTMPVEFPPGFDGDLLIFGRSGSWVQEGVSVAPGGTLTIGPRSVPGGPAGLLAALGDIVNWLPVSRATSAAERAKMLDYYAPRGAAGYLTVGPELVTNGDFATDTDWTKGTDWTIGSGVATKTAGTAAGLDQAIALVAGERYLLTFDLTRTAGTLTPQFTGGTEVSGSGRTVSGSYAEVLTAVSGNDTLRLNGNATFAGTVDNVSLKLLTVGA
jgi:hypothetical protein